MFREGAEAILNLMSDVFSLLSKSFREELDKAGFKKPTEIQELAFPVILNKENSLLIAPTGTGKTEAVVLPIFELLLRKRSEEQLKGISILYITPLRSLNRDIFRRLTQIGKNLDIDVQVRHGDTPANVRRMQAVNPPNMLITTPETLQAILPGKRMQRHLSSVRWVIVDEVHEVATDKRGAQLSLGLERLRDVVGLDFQRIGLSATVGSSEPIASFLAGRGGQIRVIKAFEPKEFEIWVESPPTTDDDERLAKNVLLSAGSVSRIRRLINLVEEHRSTLIFTNTREHAEALASRIRVLKPNLKIGIHHGSLSRDIRMETERAFREGELKAVVCTSSLELGIDVGAVDFVIQYLSPRQVTKLIQRVGRSGHLIGAKPSGCILTAWPDDILEGGVIARLALENALETLTVHQNAMDVLAHQIVGMILDKKRVSVSDAFRIVTGAGPYATLALEEFMSVVTQLQRVGLIRLDGDIIKLRLLKAYRYYFENLSMIPDVKQYTVFDFVRRLKIGILDQEFVGRNGKPGVEFIMHGQTWRIISVNEEKMSVDVEPVAQTLGAIPSWEGEIIPVPLEVAQRVGELRWRVAEKIVTSRDPLEALEGYPLDSFASAKVVDAVRRHMEKGFSLPTHNRIVVECFENYAIIHACFGNLVNETLSRVLGTVLSARLGAIIAVQSDPYRIAFIAPHRIDGVVLRKELLELRPEDVKVILSETLSDTSIFAWHFWHIAKRFGIVERNAEYKLLRARTLVDALRGTPVYQEALRELQMDKFDFDKTQRIIQEIRNGKIEVDIIPYGSEYSPFALPILDKIAPQDLLRPAVPTRAVVDVVKERLKTARVRLVCVFKADWEGVYSVKNVPDRIRCPKCNFTLIAAVYEGDTELRKIVDRKIKKQKLTGEEEKKWLTAWKNAGLVQTYGKEAVIVLSGRGIGPTTAARILRKPHKTEEAFYMDIVRAEREYARTRMFWD